jgi:hypothetical protein
MKRASAILGAVLVLGVVGVIPAGSLTPVKVIGTRASEFNPAASQEYLAWNVWTGRTNIVYAKPFGGERFRVSPTGSHGYAGAIDGTTLIYQRYSPEKATSDLFLFDLVTKQQTKLPAPINTTAWEYDPSMSGDLVAYARWFRDGTRRIYLRDDAASSLEVIASSSGRRRGLSVGQVSGGYVAYERYAFDARDRFTSCEVYRYDVATGTTTKIPNAGTRCQFGSSVDPAGTVYFGRSAFTCGVNSELRAYPVGGPVSTLTSLADGRDFATSYAVDNGDGTTDVYFDPTRCGRAGDVYKVTTPA